MKIRKKKIILLNLITTILTLLLNYGSFLTVQAEYLGTVEVNVNMFDNVYYVQHSRDDPSDYVSYPMGMFHLSNGRLAYCIQPVVIVRNKIYDIYNDVSMSDLSVDTVRRIELIGYYGYEYPGHQTRNFYLATQELIWESIKNIDAYFTTERYGNGSSINVDYEKNIIMDLVNNHYKKPSFDLSQIQANVGDTVRITDVNQVLSSFEVISSGSHQISIDGNDLVVKVSSKQIGTENIVLQKKKYDMQTSLIYKSNNSQTLMSTRATDPVKANLRIKTIGGQIDIHKLDADTNMALPSGEATLKNAVYGLYDENNNLIQRLYTNPNGCASATGLPLGKYYIQEIEASNGYLLDPTRYEVNLINTGSSKVLFSQIVKEKVIDREIEINKFYATDQTGILQPEINIKFGFYNNQNRLKGTITTNKQGYGKIKLPYGTYTVKQLNNSLNTEKVDDFQITVNEHSDDVIRYTLVNAEIKAKLKVIKVDQETGNVIKRANIKFKIFDIAKQEYVCQTITYPTGQTICEYETDENGILMTPYVLPSGKYLLEEVDQQLDGYLWNDEALQFEIGENSNLIHDDEYGFLLEVRFENQPVKGITELHKKGEQFIIENGKYHYEEIKLDDVTFEVRAREDIVHGGKTYFKKNELVETITTDENGFASLSNLPLGKYYLKEIATKGNHVLDSQIYEFELKYKDQYTDIVYSRIETKNFLAKGKLDFTKKDLITGESLPNTTIEIYTEDDQLIFTGITNENGQIIIDDLPVGKYYMIEKEAPAGYILNTEKMLFEIKENGQVLKCEMTNELIEVPDTEKKEIDYISTIGVIVIIGGIAFLIYDKKTKK